jgi:hypothetical protein
MDAGLALAAGVAVMIATGVDVALMVGGGVLGTAVEQDVAAMAKLHASTRRRARNVQLAIAPPSSALPGL